MPRSPRSRTILIVGGDAAGLRSVATDAATIEMLRKLFQRARRSGSVCTGTFILGAAGLLEGRRVTTHWDSRAALASMFPTARVLPDAIYVEDGALYTSAGITAAMDLALVLIEADLGRRLAAIGRAASRIFLRRAGEQSQFSATLAAQADASQGDLATYVYAAARHDTARVSAAILRSQIAPCRRKSHASSG